MGNSKIPLKTALKEMERFDADGKAVPFQVRWVSLSGTVIECKKGILAKNSGKLNSFVPLEKGGQGIANKSIKAANHSKNRTRNILFLDSNQIRKLKIHLITQFNNQTVVL
jgi:hypothetical protein